VLQAAGRGQKEAREAKFRLTFRFFPLYSSASLPLSENRMIPLRTLAYLFAVSVGAFSLAPLPLPAAENTVTLKGRVDLAGLDIPAGSFTVRALRPQKPSIEIAKTSTGNNGDFQLAVPEETIALYGVVLEAAATNNPAVALEANVLRMREATSPIVINLSSTIETALLNWRVQTHGNDLESLRPFVLFEWLKPVSDPKTRDGLKRAETLIVKWAVTAAGPASSNTAAVLPAAMGDVRQMEKRLTALRVAPDAIKQLQETAKKDPEVAYILMMPYFLEL
jgi:hypothetical protein